MASQRSERETQQRRAIRSVIQGTGRPMSPREVLDSALPQSPGLGIATVYRTLRNGVETGWLTPVELPGEPPRYESTGKHHHHHFHCRSCDRVYEIEGCPDGLRSLTPAGFSLEAHEVVLYGLCSECKH